MDLRADGFGDMNADADDVGGQRAHRDARSSYSIHAMSPRKPHKLRSKRGRSRGSPL
jgi:hypothetical protein